MRRTHFISRWESLLHLMIARSPGFICRLQLMEIDPTDDPINQDIDGVPISKPAVCLVDEFITVLVPNIDDQRARRKID